MGKIKEPADEGVIGDPTAIEVFLAQPAFVEDEEMESAHVHEEQLHGEVRVAFAIAHALADRQEHGGSH